VKSARRIGGSGCSSWRTPNSQLIEAKPHGTKLFGRTPADPQVGLADQVKNWPTVTANEDSYRIGGESQQSKCLSAMARRGELNGQAAPASSNTGGSRQGLSWATPRTPTGGPESAQRKQELGRTTSGGGDLASQAMTQSPTVRSCEWKGGNMTTQQAVGREPAHFNLVGVVAKESGMNAKLNPRWVETLMGLPIGWTMPSCSRPLTTAPTSCASSATEWFRRPVSERGEFLLAN